MDNYEDMLTRTFIEVPLFSKRWAEIGLSEDDLLALQIMLLKDPQSGPVMEGTGGIRKVVSHLKIEEKVEVSGSATLTLKNMKRYTLSLHLPKLIRRT